MELVDIVSCTVLALIGATLAEVHIVPATPPGRIARRWGVPGAEAVVAGGWATLLFGFVFWPLVLVRASVAASSRRGEGG